jgi:hypothetical protein
MQVKHCGYACEIATKRFTGASMAATRVDADLPGAERTRFASLQHSHGREPFLIAAIVLAVTPGPGIACVVARTVAGGRQEGLASCCESRIFGTDMKIAESLKRYLLPTGKIQHPQMAPP